MKWLRFILIAMGIGIGSFPLPGHTQQAIINLPSADLTPKGQVFIMNESYIRMWRPDRSWKATNFLTYGLNDTTELAITNFGVGAPKINNLTLAVGAKSVFQLWKKKYPRREIKLTVGAMVPVSLQGRGAGSYAYSHLSYRLPKINTRLTAGLNWGTAQIFDRDVFCFIGGIEHPITPELTVIVEYYSGTHDFGGVIPGVVYHNHKLDAVFVAGFRIPNARASGRPGFVFELGKFIGPSPHHQATAKKVSLTESPQLGVQEPFSNVLEPSANILVSSEGLLGQHLPPEMITADGESTFHLENSHPLNSHSLNSYSLNSNQAMGETWDSSPDDSRLEEVYLFPAAPEVD
jgi:hypothetical protein